MNSQDGMGGNYPFFTMLTKTYQNYPKPFKIFATKNRIHFLLHQKKKNEQEESN